MKGTPILINGKKKYNESVSFLASDSFHQTSLFGGLIKWSWKFIIKSKRENKKKLTKEWQRSTLPRSVKLTSIMNLEAGN